MTTGTREFTVGGVTINAEDMPRHIRETVVFFDKLNADLEDVVYKQNVLISAITAVKSKLQADIIEYVKTNTEQKPDSEVRDNESE